MSDAGLDSRAVKTLQSPIRLETVILAVSIAAAFYLCWLLVRPFLAALVWAASLAILANPLNAKFERRMRSTVAAMLTVGAVIFLVVAPAIFLGQQLFLELNQALQALADDLNRGDVASRLAGIPAALRFWEWIKSTLDVEQQLRAGARSIAASLSTWVGGSIWLVTQWIVTFLALFYFLRDREQILGVVRHLIPLPANQTKEMLSRIARTVHASLYKNLLVKAIQGALGGLMFWFLGLPSPILFGAVMGLVALLPLMGTAIVWLPAAIYLLVTGSWVKAIILLVWGAFVVGLIDNFLYPILVAGDLQIHPLAVFFSVFGGLIVFGFTGLVLGPVILAITVALMELWEMRSSKPSAEAEF